MAKKIVHRINNRVKIINPEIFVRCGYPLTKQIVKETLITDDQKQKIKKFLKDEFDIGWPQQEIFLEPAEGDEYYKGVLDVVARGILLKNSWGGDEKTIHTELKPEFLNREGRVISKKVKRTGKYVCGCSYQGYYDPYPEYENAYLSNGKTHVILELSIYDEKLERHNITGYQTIWIEECHVEKLKH